MAKERTVEEKAARKAEKKEKKRSESEGVSKKSKKDKKEKKSKSAVEDDEADPATAVLNALENEKPGSVAVDKDGDVVVAMNGDDDKENKTTSKRPVGILVPFANPLADDKQVKRIFKAVKKGMGSHRSTCMDEDLTPSHSECTKNPQARREGSQQVPPQVLLRASDLFLDERSASRRRNRRRCIAYGRHHTSACTLRRSQCTIHLCLQQSRAGRGGQHKETHERSHDLP